MKTYVWKWLCVALLAALVLGGCRKAGTGGAAAGAGGSTAGPTAGVTSGASESTEAGGDGTSGGAAGSADSGDTAGGGASADGASAGGASAGGADSGNAAATIDENGTYTSKDEVALYLHTYGHLPSNFLTKSEARDRGWVAEQGNLHQVAPGMSIGGDRFGNREGLLPDAAGRTWYECDINYAGGRRGAERIVYSNDGLIFYTGDHYASYEQLYP